MDWIYLARGRVQRRARVSCGLNKRRCTSCAYERIISYQVGICYLEVFSACIPQKYLRLPRNILSCFHPTTEQECLQCSHQSVV
jgi:hypothetical protein